MLTRRVIPCLDLDAGRVVKGVRFAGLRDAGDPAELARRYEAAGADELCLLDVSATIDARPHAIATVARVRASLGIPLTVGGGVRSLADARELLGAGADKVAVNSAALHRPELIEEIAATLGRQCCVVSIDAARARGSPPAFEVVVHGGRRRTGIDAASWASEATRRGAGEVLLTSLDRDGTRDGFDLALIAAVRAVTAAPIIASGGAGGRATCAGHCLAALEAGADAVLAASVFHFDGLEPDELKRALALRGARVRL